jgi:hypothetical protein
MHSTMYEMKTRSQCIVTNMTTARQRFVKHCLTARIVEPEQKPIAHQTHVPAATNRHGIIHCWATVQ